MDATGRRRANVIAHKPVSEAESRTIIRTQIRPRAPPLKSSHRQVEMRMQASHGESLTKGINWSKKRLLNDELMNRKSADIERLQPADS